MLTYLLVAPILYLLSYLPTGAMYRLADVVAFFLRVVIKYRKEVVWNNVRNSFPGMGEKERAKIVKESYTHLADKIVENIRCIRISKEEIEERLIVKNTYLLDEYYNQGKHVVFMIGHIGAWEFATYTLCIICKHKFYALVSKVSNDYFNRMVQRTRGKMGAHLIFMQDSKDFFTKKLPEPSAVGFISDQSPSNLKRAYWTKFLNQDTAFFTGGEGYARLHNCAVVYAKITHSPRGRGYYLGEFIKITDAAAETKENEITEKYVRLLEEHILENPADWLWSHKRWKHKPLKG